MIKRFFIAVLVNGLTLPGNAEQLTLYYDSDQYMLTVEHRRQLEPLQHAETITITGHADSDALADYNQTLSKKRAHEVYDYFRSTGFPEAYISMNYKGEQQPVVEEIGDAGKAKNRRVVIQYTFNYDLEDTSQLMTHKEPEISRFRNEDGIHHITANGIEITIPPFSFDVTSGEEVTLHVREYVKMEDIMMANLTTTSNGELLETNGMVHLEAYADGRQVPLSGNTEATISFPKDREGEFKLFTGGRHGAEIDWRESRGCRSRTDKPVFRTPYVRYSKIRWAFSKKYRKAMLKERKRAKQEAYRIYKAQMMAYKTQNLAEPEANTYTYSLCNLGWINCDRFRKIPPKNKIHFAVNTTKGARVNVVFLKQKTMLLAKRQTRRHVFGAIPKNVPILVIATRKQHGQVYIAYRKTTPSERVVKNLEYKPVSEEELLQFYASLN